MAKEGIPSVLLHGDDNDEDEDDFELKPFGNALILSAGAAGHENVSILNLNSLKKY